MTEQEATRQLELRKGFKKLDCSEGHQRFYAGTEGSHLPAVGQIGKDEKDSAAGWEWLATIGCCMIIHRYPSDPSCGTSVILWQAGGLCCFFCALKVHYVQHVLVTCSINTHLREGQLIHRLDLFMASPLSCPLLPFCPKFRMWYAFLGFVKASSDLLS